MYAGALVLECDSISSAERFRRIVPAAIMTLDDGRICTLCAERIAVPRASLPANADADAAEICDACVALPVFDRQRLRDAAQMRLLAARKPARR